MSGTEKEDYTKRLIDKQSVWWKTFLNVQLPYKWNIKRIRPGFTLDVGCGVGRNLLHLDKKGIGVDHNTSSVEICKQKGLQAFTVADFLNSEFSKEKSYDSILIAHVLEHMTVAEGKELIRFYLKYLKDDGKIITITPQEAGYKSDRTHVTFIDFKKVEEIFSDLDIYIEKSYSFPFPRFIGKIFKYNEFICIAKKRLD